MIKQILVSYRTSTHTTKKTKGEKKKKKQNKRIESESSG